MALKSFLSFALLLAVPLAHAAEVPVTYVVEAKAIKDFTNGTPATFELHATSACDAAVHTEVINAGDPPLVLEKVITKRVRKGPKVPKEIHLRTTLDSSVAQQDYYLKVTGVGIRSVGKDCQVQHRPGHRLSVRKLESSAAGPIFLHSPSCASDEVLSGGGCSCTNDAEGSVPLRRTEPSSIPSTWYCECARPPFAMKAFALCMKLDP